MNQRAFSKLIFFFATATFVSCASVGSSGHSANARTPSSGTAFSGALGNLNWGSDPRSNTPWSANSLQSYIIENPTGDIAIQAQGLVSQANSDIARGLVIAPVPALFFTGILPTDPKHIASQNAVNQLPHIFGWAVCARLGNPDQASACLNAVIQAIVGTDSAPGWSKIYQPTGAPIDESRLIELFLAIDWILPLLSDNDQTSIKNWLTRFVTQGDLVFSEKHANDNTRVNNFNTWRLAIRSIVADVVGDQTLKSTNPGLVHQQMKANLLPTPGWSSDPTCTNDLDITSYVSLDFRQRDALTYHAFNLKAFSEIGVYTPENELPGDHHAIANAFNFMKPYYLGQKTHIEFVCSTTPYDQNACAEGNMNYCRNPWDPSSKLNPINAILLEARAAFPEIRDWTTNSVNQKNPVSLMFRAAVEFIP